MSRHRSRAQVTADERTRLTSARSVNPQAHDAYLLGRSHIKRNEDDLSQAIQYFERAIQLAPDYAAAQAGLSDAWVQRGIWGAKHFGEVESPARAAAVKAVELDPQLAEAHASLSRIKSLFEWDWAGAEQELRLALELDPGRLYTHSFDIAAAYVALGDRDEAFRILDKAVEERDSLLVNLKEDPSFDDLHSYPRWKALLRRMNFPPE